MDKNTTNLMFSSKSNDWATPQSFFDKLNGIFGPFTLDAAASPVNYKVANHYTEADDALSQDWSDNTVFLNPPYGRNLKDWVKKAYEEGQKDDTTVVMLIPAYTSNGCWHTDIFPYASHLVFFRYRLDFGGPFQRAGGARHHRRPYP